MKKKNFIPALTRFISDKSLRKICFSLLSITIVIFSSIYIYRTNIYYPISIKIINPIDSSINIKQVTVKTVLGQNINALPDSTNANFLIDFGYFNNITLNFKSTVDNNTINFIKIFDTNTNKELEFESSLDKEKIIIHSVGKKSILSRIIRIIEINQLKMLFILILIAGLYFTYVSVKHPEYKISRLNKPLNFIFLFIILASGFFALILAALHTYPNAEDLALTSPSGTFRPFTNAIKVLLVYDARYTANFLYGCDIFTLGGVYFHKINSLFLVIITAFTGIFLYKSIFKDYLNSKISIALGLSFVLLHFATSPSVAFDLFYIGSSYVYLLSCIFIFAWVSFFILLTKEKNLVKKSILASLTFILLFLSFGLIELNIFINFYIIAIIAYFIIKYRKDLKHELIIIAIIFVLSTCFIAIIPGNSLRIYASPIEHSASYFYQTFSTTLQPFISNILKWTFYNPFGIPAVFCLAILFNKNKIQDKILLSLKELIFIIIGGILCLYACYYIFVFTNKNMINEGYPLRLINYINWGYLIIIYLLVPLALCKIKSKFWSLIYPHFRIILNIALVFFGIFIVFQPNELKNIIQEYRSGEYGQFKTEMTDRFNKITLGVKQNNHEKIVIPEIQTKPSTLFVYEKDLLKNDPELQLWIEKYNRYFETNKIVFENDSSKSISVNEK